MRRSAVAARRKKQILEGLFAAIARKGFSACSVRDVARESGLACGALHYYFENKEQMLVELMRSLGERHLAGLREYRDRFEDPLDRILAVFRYHLVPDDEPSLERTRVWIEYWGYGVEAPELRGVISEIQAAIRADIRADVQAGVRRGLFGSVDPEAAAVLLLSLVEGPMLQRTYGHRSPEGSQLASELRALVERYLGKRVARARHGRREKP
ncbi:MAG: TetR family transcriptional regulator C-terminal domain-containing protein [Deltaproteobacteria bacterium]|nr:TetR family transcriptional regulator C-terminal domain-containing protein [Deltaproteobacteria bacterium]